MTEPSLIRAASVKRRRCSSWTQFATGLGVLLVVIALSSLARPQESSPSQSRPGDEYTIRVDVDMVILHATAQDHKHALVSGLDKDDFQVYEDGVLQPIKNFSHEDIPVTVGLVIDNSGSMGAKRADVIAAGLAFARSSNPQDQMFVVNFNERVSFGLPVNTPFTDQVAQLEVALSRIRAQGETALYDAVAAALEHLKMGNRDKKVLIIISDGGDNASKHKLAEIIAMVGQPDAIIYTIGIFDEQDAGSKPRGAQAACQGHGRRGLLAGIVKGRCSHLRKDRTRYPQSVHDRICPYEQKAGRNVSSHPSESQRAGSRTLVGAHPDRLFRTVRNMRHHAAAKSTDHDTHN